MPRASNASIQVRDAGEVDVPALTLIKGAATESIHRDRLRAARAPGFRYLVLLAGQEPIGLACLVTRRPAHWSDADDTQQLPQIVDLQVAPAHRGQGYGTAFIHALELMAAEAGHDQVFLSVDPVNNPRAFALYLRLGYQPLQPAPYRKQWSFVDYEGHPHGGEDWEIDMVKEL